MENQISDSLKELSRRVDTLQKSVDTQVADRNILEDILTRLSAVEQALHMNKDHQTDVAKDMKADLLDVKHAVDDKIEEVRLDIKDNTVLVKSATTGIIDKIKAKLNHE